MIKAIIFDLDGTLIQTEVLKATSYARAIQALTHNNVKEQQVLDIFGKYVGLSREEVMKGLYGEFAFELQKQLESKDSDFLKDTLIKKRLDIYRNILEDTTLLSEHFCQFTLGLFQKLVEDSFELVLATMSHLSEAKRITSIMGIYEKFNLVLTRDDVQEGKPNPEIYNKAFELLNLKPQECIIIEDSVNGIKAGLNAGAYVFAVTNHITRKSVHDCNLLPSKFIVDELETLTERVYSFINEKEKEILI